MQLILPGLCADCGGEFTAAYTYQDTCDACLALLCDRCCESRKMDGSDLCESCAAKYCGRCHGHLYSDNELESRLCWDCQTANYLTFTICEAYLSALINDDDSGLDENDAADFRQWLDSLTDLPPGQWDYYDGDAEYTECDVSGLYASCCKVCWVDMSQRAIS